jgi:hypothetical protein
MPGVADAICVSQPFKLVSREVKEEDTVTDLDGVSLGGKAIRVMGPCSVESKEQLLEAAHAVKPVGATFVRGGAFKLNFLLAHPEPLPGSVAQPAAPRPGHGRAPGSPVAGHGPLDRKLPTAELLVGGCSGLGINQILTLLGLYPGYPLQGRT